MAKRRTKSEVDYNEMLLENLFNEGGGNSPVVVSTIQLRNGGWKGSMPYTVPMSQGMYAIKQDKMEKGDSRMFCTYSIIILK